MKRVYLLTFLTFVILFANAQKNDKNPFENFKGKDNQKPTLIYVFPSWCAETISQYATIADTLQKYRDRFNLVVLIATSNKQYKT